MGNAIATIDTSGYPAIGGRDAERLMKVRQKNLGSRMEESDFPRIILPRQGGVNFTIPGPEGDVLETSLSGIVVFHSERKAYWEKDADDPESGGPPDCSSIDGDNGKGKPGGKCLNCPYNQWGSGKGNSKACADHTLIFLLRKGELLPDLIRIPPTSVRAIRQFFIALFSKGILYYQVEIELVAAKGRSKSGIDLSTFSMRAKGTIADEQMGFVESFHEGIEKAALSVSVVEDAANDLTTAGPEDNVPF